MELAKKLISVQRGKCRGTIQLTLDDDFNVPDRKSDIGQIVASQGNIHTNEITPAGERVQLAGALQFQILYISEQDGKMQGMEGEIPFHEWVNLSEDCTGQVQVRWMIEDLSVDVIHSRKISVRAVVAAEVRGEEDAREEVAEDIQAAEGEEVFLQKRFLPLIFRQPSKKDTFRIKDEYVLPSAKPNIEELVYWEVALRGVETRLLEDKFSLKGELSFMVFYYGGESDKLQYLELELPFSGMPECQGCLPDRMPDIEVSILSRNMQVKADEDGEERILDVEVVLELTVSSFSEEKVELLSDFYTSERHLEPVYRELDLLQFYYRHSGKLRPHSKVHIPENAYPILQLCGTSGTVHIDDCEWRPEGLHVEGVVELPILYLTAEDQVPMGSVKGILPFEETISTKEDIENQIDHMQYEIHVTLDQVALGLTDSREIDAKTIVDLDVLLFAPKKESVIEGYHLEELSEEEKQNQPGLIGCYVQEGDSWWSIGKRYRTSVDRLKLLNGDELEPGMRLMIAKDKGFFFS